MSNFISHQAKVQIMLKNKAIIILALTQALTMIAVAQRTDTTATIINLQLKDNQADFSSMLRPLRQIAGAPGAFYSYFWEFGDGNFSFEEHPKHIYNDTGTYNVRLYATNNYDDGKPPPTRPKHVRVNSKSIYYAANSNQSFFRHGGTIEMKVNSMPRADEDMILIVGYRNENKNIPLTGSLVLFYNEKQFRKNNFNLTEERTYNNETKSSLHSIAAFSSGQEITETASLIRLAGPNASGLTGEPIFSARKFSDLLITKQKIFRENNVWRFNNLSQGEEKFFFLTLHTTPEMIKDTNSVVTLTGMFVPDDINGEIEEYSLELQIVASHDPNRMMLKNRRLNYRFTGANKEMEYTIRFQNTGSGPSKQITVAASFPSMLDPKSIRILNFYPKCIMCDSTTAGQSCLDTLVQHDSIYFVFKNIYLPGLRQTEMRDPDSTIGFVKYRVHFNKKLKKIPFESKAAIVFDDNKPIHTNSPKGYFKPGNSPAAIIGYNKYLENPGKTSNNENYWMIGGSISPYSPYKKYLQAELFFGLYNIPEQFVNRAQNIDTSINNTPWLIVFRDTYEKRKVYQLNLVPLQLRYNFIEFLGAGLGTQLSFDALTQTTYHKQMLLAPQGGGQPMTLTEDGKQTRWFNNFDAAIFGDLQIGKVRVGPVAGIRYLHYFRFPQNRLLVYAAWRL